jgi:hypothetical protein
MRHRKQVKNVLAISPRMIPEADTNLTGTGKGPASMTAAMKPSSRALKFPDIKRESEIADFNSGAVIELLSR